MNIYKAHEIRMWITTIVVPAALGVILIGSNPKVQMAVKNTANKIKNVFRKKKSLYN